MNEEQDSLHQLPAEKWIKLQNALGSDLPRCISGYNLLKVQRRWLQQGFDYGFKVFCPFGDVGNGMVAFVFHAKAEFYEMFVECPQDDTTELEEALRRTKSINWKKNIVAMFCPSHVVQCFKKISKAVHVDMDVHKCDLYILDKRSPSFDVSLPPEISFKLLSPDHVEFVDSVWPHRFPGSTRYFGAMIQNKFGYGLFKNEDLIAWTFIKEMGALGHIYTLEEHRKEGYGEMIVKLICNVLVKESIDMFSYVVDGNNKACKLHEKIGFEVYSEVGTCLLRSKDNAL